MPIDRTGYPNGRTLGEIIASTPPGAQREFLDREASIVVDDIPLRDCTFRNLTEHPQEVRGARSFLEVLTLARGLAFLSYRDVRARRTLHPDFDVELGADREKVSIEVTDASQTSAYQSRIQDLRLQILDEIRKAQISLDGRLIMMTFCKVLATSYAANLGLTPRSADDSVPFRRRDKEAFVNEFLNWIRAGEHLTDRSDLVPVDDPRFPELSRWEAVITCCEMEDASGAFDFMYFHVGQTHGQIVQEVHQRIKSKRAKASHYTRTGELWLFIEISDRAFRARRALEHLIQNPTSIEPYELLLVVHDDCAVAVDAKAARRLDFVSSNREMPFWPLI